MRKLLEFCQLPNFLIDSFAPYTYQQAKEALLKSDIDMIVKILNSDFQGSKEEDSLLLFALSEAKEETIIFLVKEYSHLF